MNNSDIDVDLRLTGKVVSRCCIDYAFIVEFLEKKMRTVIRIGGEMNIIGRNGENNLNLTGDKPSDAGQASSIFFGKTVQEATGKKDGRLDISFTDGTRLLVRVHQKYEAWELSADDGFMVVSLPGGKLAIWGPR
jgi:hypothetical protein